MANTDTAVAGLGGGGMFTRRATSLVREMDGVDAWLMNILEIHLLGVRLYTLGPNVYPGVNMALGDVLTTVVVILPIMVYAWLAAAMLVRVASTFTSAASSTRRWDSYSTFSSL
jgi:hypothetical protein